MNTFEACITDLKYRQAVQADSDFAVYMGVRSTPTFFINGRPLVGAQPIAEFSRLINPLLRQQPESGRR